MQSDRHGSLSRLARSPRRAVDVAEVERRARRGRAVAIVSRSLAVVLILVAGSQVAARFASDGDGPQPQGGGLPEYCPYDDYHVTIYLRDDVTDNEFAAIRADLEALPGVARIDEVTHEDAYEEFRAYHRDEPEFYENLPHDALPRAFRIALEDPEGYEPFLVFADERGVDTVMALVSDDRASTMHHEGDAGCPPYRTVDRRSSAGQPDRTEDGRVIVASGTFIGNEWGTYAGQDWRFIAHLEGGSRCHAMVIGDGPDTPTCTEGALREEAVGTVSYHPVGVTGGTRSLTFGEVREDVVRLEFHLEDGSVVVAEPIRTLLSSESGADYYFAELPASRLIEIVALGKAGEVAGRERL